MRLSILFFVLLNFSSTVFAEKILPSRQVISARRAPDETFSQALERFKNAYKRFAIHNKLPTTPQDGVYDHSLPYDALTFQQALVPDWESMEVLQTHFEKLRDTRFLFTSGNKDFARRLTWLYPDDGCYDRATYMRRLLEKWGEKLPAKLFILGDLEVDTGNHPSGSVSWYYHVVPLVRVGDKPYVLDPSIEPSRPLEVREWAARQTSDLRHVGFSICNAYAYSIASPCLNASIDDEGEATDSVTDFLSEEWERQIELNREPAEVLGDSPPWK